MKEAIGSTYIFVICITFIVLFTAYLAISVNYSKAFKIKSYIVNAIEENNGLDGNLSQGIETYLTAQGYSAYGDCQSTLVVKDNGGSPVTTTWNLDQCINNFAPTGKCNACIYKMDLTTANDDICADRSYYKVTTFFKFDLPVVNVLLTFQISGDSGYIMGNSTC